MLSEALGTREVRIAPVMTGGTSLSVWMGGATVELYRMLRPADNYSGIYGRLLSLTQTKPVVDVVTGTSAGGLNGTLLAAALSWQVDVADFESLREVWMQAADLGKLISDSESSPNALLDGDRCLTPIVEARLREWQQRHPGNTDPEIDLLTTFTAIRPRRRVLVDDFQERMDEEVYAGTIRHVGAELNEPDTPALLAWGARVSAAIPGVFDSVFLPIDGAVGQVPPFGNRLRLGPDSEALSESSPNVAGVWAVDGGLVNNLPLGDALERIFEQQSQAQVRRVVLYVSPTPQGPQHAQESADEQPPFTKAIFTAVSAPRAEGVGGDLREIGAHNSAVRRQRAARAALPLLAPDSYGAQPRLDGQILVLYRRLRGEESVERTMTRYDQLAADLDDAQPRAAVREALLAARMNPQFLPESLPSPNQVADSPWAWGISPIEQAVSTTLGLINRALALPLAVSDAQRAEMREWRSALIGAKANVHSVKTSLQDWRTRDREYWRTKLVALAEAPNEELLDRAVKGYAEWPGEPRGESLTELTSLMREMAEVLREIEDPFLSLITYQGATFVGRGDTEQGVEPSPPQRLRVIEDAEALLAEYRALASGPDAECVMVSLLASHILQVTLLGDIIPREQPVEILQLSWNSPDLISNKSSERKLVGNEAARLGAFLLPSWRANDFLWGQLDAAPRLVSLLLDPHRLAQLGHTPDQVLDHLQVAHTEPLLSELKYLTDAGPIPTGLPILTQTLARQRQIEIARAGLGGVRESLGLTGELGGNITSSAQSFMDRYDTTVGASDPATLSDDRVVALMGALAIGDETLTDQRGTVPMLLYGERLLGAADGMLRHLVSEEVHKAFRSLADKVRNAPWFHRLLGFWRRLSE